MKIKLVVDSRESKLITCLKNLIDVNEKLNHVSLINENLDIGDIIIRDENDKDILIFERKSIDDLIASIKDGRYTEQSFRLNGLEHVNHNIIYIIEGNIGFSNKQLIYSSIFSLNYYKGFSVYRSLSVEETAYILCNMCLKINKEKNKKPYYNNKVADENESEKPEVSYSSVVKKKKNANITQENFGEIVLIQIPGISDITAIAIMKEYKTINNLIEKLNENKDILNSFTYENEKKQKRKLNKTCISNILKFLIQ
jgi:ERCC4-type nuclease